MAQTQRSVAVCMLNTEGYAQKMQQVILNSNGISCGPSSTLFITTAYLSDAPIDVTQQQNSTSCTLAGGSTNAWCELGNMSIANAQQISLSVGLVWAIAWTFKVLRKSISLKGSEE